MTITVILSTAVDCRGRVSAVGVNRIEADIDLRDSERFGLMELERRIRTVVDDHFANNIKEAEA